MGWEQWRPLRLCWRSHWICSAAHFLTWHRAGEEICGCARACGDQIIRSQEFQSNKAMTEAASRSAFAGRTYAGALVEEAYSRLADCADERARIAAAAHLILAIFDDFYGQLCEYPYRAKRAFETMDPHASIQISRERLELYSRYIAEHGPRIFSAFPALSNNAIFWDELDRVFVAMIAERYEADIAFSFVHSIRRNIDHGIWRPVAYSFPPPSKRRACSMAAVHRRLPVYGRVDVALLTNALQVPAFTVFF